MRRFLNLAHRKNIPTVQREVDQEEDEMLKVDILERGFFK